MRATGAIFLPTTYHARAMETGYDASRGGGCLFFFVQFAIWRVMGYCQPVSAFSNAVKNTQSTRKRGWGAAVFQIGRVLGLLSGRVTN